MKTKIRTFIAICVLGFMGFVNINAIADERKTTNNEAMNKAVEVVNNESVNNNLEFLNLEQELTGLGSDAQVEMYAKQQILFSENSVAKPGFIKSAESITDQGSDLEISKYVQKLKDVVNEKGRN